MKHVIVGEGRSALRAAAWLGDALWLTSTADSPESDQIPEDRGTVSASDGAAERVGALYGAAPAALAATRGIALGAKVHPLPLRRRDLARLLPPDAAREALRDWARARARIHLRRLVGGGLEERTYADWVIHRVGEGAFEHIYRHYGERRFGPTDRVNAAAARFAHALPDDGPRVGLGASPAEGIATLRRKVGRTELGCVVEGAELRDGRIAALRTNRGEIPIEGKLWWAGSLPALVPILGDLLSESTRWELLGLPARHRAQVLLRGVDPSSLPGEVHVLDAAPFFKVSRPDQTPGAGGLSDAVVAHLALADEDPLWRGPDAALVQAVAAALPAVGLTAGSGAAGAVVLRMPHHEPAWEGVWHPWHVRASEALAKLGVQLVGRGATYRRIDAGRELLLLEALARKPGDAHEAYRVLADPPVVCDDEQASFVRFVER